MSSTTLISLDEYLRTSYKPACEYIDGMLRQKPMPTKLHAWIAAKGWETVLNRRGTAFRKLDPAQTADLDADKAVPLMQASPSTIKRPVVEYPGGLLVGFDAAEWGRVLG